MDATGYIVWIIVGLVLGVGAAAFMAFSRNNDLVHSALYVVPAALLGTFMGSQAFTSLSDWGPDIGGYNIIPSLIFGIILTAFAAVASEAPAPPEEELLT